MARTPQGGERALLAGDHNTHVVFSVLDHLGTWHDLTSYVVSINFGETIDSKGQDGTITLLRELVDDGTGLTSISPHVVAATLNNIGGSFVPLVDGGRYVTIVTNISAVGAAAGTYREMFFGRISNPDVGEGSDANTMTITIADNASRLMENWIQVARDYGSDAGVAIETVMQQILNDNPPADGYVPTLLVPVSPAVNLHAFTQDKQPVLDALKALAAQIGWDVRYVYDAADVLQLMFYEPDRAKSVSDFTIGPSEYYTLPQFVANTDDIRTMGVVRFLDRASNSVLSATAQAPSPVIAQYGTRYIEIAEDATSVIDSITEAQAMIDAIIADLGQPYATQVIELDYFPLVQLGDLCTFTANGEQYDADQHLAVVAISHALTAQGDTTTLTCRGAVAGAYKNWLLLHGSGRSTNGPTGDEIYLANFRIVARDAVSVTYGWDDTPNAVEVWVFDKTLPMPVGVEPWPDLTTAIAPTQRLDPGANTLQLTFPAMGFERFVQLDPRSATHVAGDQHRIVLQPVGTPPTFGEIKQSIGASGLFASLSLFIDDAEGLGGILEAWVNRSDFNNADPTGAADATIGIGFTPATVDAFATWSNGVNLLSNIRVHPGRGKQVFFRFTNTKGIDSGIQSFQILSEGGIIDENGVLLPGMLNDAIQFAANIQPVQVFVSALPGTAPDGQFAFLTSTGKLYRRVSGAWTSSVDGADIITSSIVAGKIAAGAINSTAIAAGAVTATHLSISVLASITPDLGVIVAGSLTGVSGAISINLNATGTARIFDSPGLFIQANGLTVFSGTVVSSTFSATSASFGQHISVGAIGNTGASISVSENQMAPLFSSWGTVGSISAVDYTAPHGAGMVLGAFSAIYVGAPMYFSTDPTLAGGAISYGAANSGGAGFRLVLVPN